MDPDDTSWDLTFANVRRIDGVALVVRVDLDSSVRIRRNNFSLITRPKAPTRFACCSST